MIRLTNRLAELWALLGGALVFSIMIATTINVAGFGLDRAARTFGWSVPGLPGYEDFVTLAIASAALMFLPYCQVRRGHVKVDVFTNLLPASAPQLLDRLWLFATAALAGFLAYWMLVGLLETRADNVLSPVLGWTVWPFYVPGIVSLILWGTVAAAQSFESEPDA